MKNKHPSMIKEENSFDEEDHQSFGQNEVEQQSKQNLKASSRWDLTHALQGIT